MVLRSPENAGDNIGPEKVAAIKLFVLHSEFDNVFFGFWFEMFSGLEDRKKKDWAFHFFGNTAVLPPKAETGICWADFWNWVWVQWVH